MGGGGGASPLQPKDSGYLTGISDQQVTGWARGGRLKGIFVELDGLWMDWQVKVQQDEEDTL